MHSQHRLIISFHTQEIQRATAGQKKTVGGKLLMELLAAGCKLLHWFDPPTQLSQCVSGPLSTCSPCSHPRAPCLIPYICHRLLSAKRFLMPLVKTCRGGLGSAPACPRTADFPNLGCLFLLEPDGQKQKCALHHSSSTMICLPMQKCEANFSSRASYTRYEPHYGQML